MANGYADNLTIERINNDGDYEPSNCKWILNKDQPKNNRQAKPITYKGKTKIISDWARELGFNIHTLQDRIRRGWSVEKAFEKPVKIKSTNKKEVI